MNFYQTLNGPINSVKKKKIYIHDAKRRYSSAREIVIVERFPSAFLREFYVTRDSKVRRGLFGFHELIAISAYNAGAGLIFHYFPRTTRVN
ncbi:hypothetical protein PUN28_003139 [Cardiocondyla obscurior]|uniref:Uncharacterized protein n=1 Tax=Cardiocondyla obscurior TaxID=286306 RepID=A0AAW2GJB0_9HYME